MKVRKQFKSDTCEWWVNLTVMVAWVFALILVTMPKYALVFGGACIGVNFVYCLEKLDGNIKVQ